ncbi:MAG: HAD hydrolase-like protein [Treponema sp.]|nr:HAD hydrolase-like protein [Treponema sp.]
MSNFENILFDFDGTICDTSEGIFASMQKVCDYYKLSYGINDFRKMIGPSLKESFSTIFHLPENEITNAIKVYRDFYGVEGMYMCSPYDGVEDLIKKLRSLGKKIYVATSKPELYTKQIIQRKGMSDLFDFIGGADLAEQKRIEKIQVINYVLSENHLENKKDSCLMIGDRSYDIKGAHTAGLKACGILWGFGDKPEFEDCGADFICKTPTDVFNLIK